ncbi:MAG: PhoH family protein [Spirochaetes bacterium]|nr:PhoH family protein [Spirochaetota bacterium]
MDGEITIVLANRDTLQGICGANDGNLKIIENSLGGRIVAKGNEIRLEGASEAAVRCFKAIIDSLIAVINDGEDPSPDHVVALTKSLFSAEMAAGAVAAPAGAESPAQQDDESSPGLKAVGDSLREAAIQIPQGFKRVYPRSANQAAYIRGMREDNICFCIGPAGTGKTYLAIAEALRLVLSKKMRKLVLTRPVVEAGESLGFLPGDLSQKISPYLRPLYDAMESLIPYETIHKMEESRAIEIAPLAYMRGRSLNDCMVILDEAQNTTKEQMKMFLTRIGIGTKALITGDVTQVDLPRKNESGLLHAIEILRKVEGVYFSFLHTDDVVRNPLIKKIIQAYHENGY